MFARATVKTPERQQGLAVLILVIIILLAFITYAFSDLSIVKVKTDQARQTQIALKKAKHAVINFAVTYSDRTAGNEFGVLPHPETYLNGNDGNMASVGGTKYTNIVDWLPWRSLDIPNLKDDSGTCLFYAVSGTYKLGASVQSDMINEDSIGMIRIVNSAGNIVQGANIEDQVVALVIAAGSPLPGQTRNLPVLDSSCGRDYGNVSAYLEGDGVTDNSTVSALPDTVDNFIHATATSASEAIPYNDRFLTITREEIWDAIVERSDFRIKMENLTHGLALCMAEYSGLTTSRRLPWPALTDLGDRRNYRDNDNYVDTNNAANGYSGRYPFNVVNSNAAIDPGILTEDEIFNITGLCNNLDVGGGITVDLETPTSEYRKLWNNWKDHFFYVLSKRYEPDNSGAQRCNPGNPCIRVNTTEYAAAVIFSGSRLPGVTRNNKELVADYLEDGKAVEFANEEISKSGDRTYIYTNPQTDAKNDIMYCIENRPISMDLTVTECS